MSKERQTHESFTQVSAYRHTSSHGRSYYGSNMPHDRGVTIEIKTSELMIDSNLGTEYNYAVKNLIEVEMTELQWAQFVSSLNMGSGTPATMTYGPTEDSSVKLMERPPLANKQEHLKDSIRTTATKLTENLKELEKDLERLTAKGAKINKRDIVDVLNRVQNAVSGTRSNLPFVVQQTQHAMDQVVQDARTDIESAMASAGVEVGSISVPSIEDTSE